jgi:O-antigen/teichoic acid export membrane protein
MPSIKKNFAYNSAYQILLIIAPIITTPYLSRIIGQSGNGIFTYTQSIANYFVLFAQLGISNYGVRTIAECGDDRKRRSATFWNAFAMSAIVGTVVTAAYVAYMLLFGRDRLLIYALWSMWILGSFLDVSWLMFGMQEFRIPTIRNFITKLASVIFIFAFVKGPNDVWAYVAAIAGSYLANSILIWPFVKDYVDWVRPTWAETKKHFKPNLVLFVPVIASSLYVLFDKIMLGSMAGMEQTGLYDYAEKISKMPLAVITALGSVVLPRMSEVFRAGRMEEGKKLIEQTMWFMLACAFALMFGIIGIARDFVPVFFGPGYSACVPIMSLLSVIIPLICSSNVIGVQYLLPSHRDMDYTKSLLAGAFVNISINLFSIPAAGALGAAFATVAAELAVLAYQAFCVRSELNLKRYVTGALPFVIIGAGMLVLMRLVSAALGAHAATILGILVEFCVAAAFYIAASCAWCIATKNEAFARIFPKLAIWKHDKA